MTPWLGLTTTSEESLAKIRQECSAVLDLAGAWRARYGIITASTQVQLGEKSQGQEEEEKMRT